MRILIINKFLYPKGGVETYILSLGKKLIENGHTIEYYGMKSDKNIVGNQYGIYSDNIDFSNYRIIDYLKTARIIYSKKNAELVLSLLEKMDPDIVHVNNFNYQLTPSILDAIDRYRKNNSKNIRIIYTAHDYSLICPAHSIKNRKTGNKECLLCVKKSVYSCVKYRCIKESLLKSIIGTIERLSALRHNSYSSIDKIICPSIMCKEYIDKYELFKDKTIVLYHFVDEYEYCKFLSKENLNKEDYVLVASSLTAEKGMDILCETIKKLPQINFIIAGEGIFEKKLSNLENVTLVGRVDHSKLIKMMNKAKALVFPSDWQEVFGLSCAECISAGTPVIASEIGGLPEVITNNKNGILIKPNNVQELEKALRKLYTKDYEGLCEGCRNTEYSGIDEYIKKLIRIYEGLS